jgi:hypothetical protein
MIEGTSHAPHSDHKGLSRFFRIPTSKGGIHSIREEITHDGLYIDIQLRYTDKFLVCFACPNHKDFLYPKLVTAALWRNHRPRDEDARDRQFRITVAPS